MFYEISDFFFFLQVMNLVQMTDVPLLSSFLDNLIRDSLKVSL